MNSSRKLVFASAALCLFLLALVAAVVALMRAGGEAGEGGEMALAFADRVAAILMVSALACVLAVAALREFHARYVRASLRLAEETGALAAHGGVRVGLDDFVAPELQALGCAVNRLASVRDALESDVAGRVRAARASLEEERSRLAALMADLNQSVIVCNLDGRILLYNQRASEESSGPAEGGKTELLGLGRSIYTLFDRSLIAHALDRLQQATGGTQFVTTTRSGRLLRAHMSPVQAADSADATHSAALSGFVLILDDITAEHERDARRDGLIQSLTEGGRGPLGNIRAAAETLADFSDMSAAQRERFLGVIRDEARTLSGYLDRAASAFSDDLRARWPLEEMLGAELVGAALRRIGERTPVVAHGEAVDGGIWLRIDSFGLLQALGFLAARLYDEYGIRDVRLALSREGRLAQLDLIWVGTSMNNETAMSWEMDSMNAGGEARSLSVRDVVDRCNGEIWFQRERASHRAYFRILLPVSGAPKDAVRGKAVAASGSRPEFYDFDLFRRSAAALQLDDCPLGELAYTVFDTETTGLDPSGGDEIIQIGATRIVNRRLLAHECFEQLVDPQRPLSAASIRIHGITPDLLLGRPTIASVLPAFHAFCADTVLVAHNAAFDMRFLQLKEASLGVRFEQPVLDTLLLSAVLHPNQEMHRLEAIAERLGVSVVGRHTALGDALVTGEVFLKMLPLLAAMGIHTLREAREASERTFHARLSY
ncbi:MAG: exonuclease domain-containing protein [Rhodocyclaceae bacterium]